MTTLPIVEHFDVFEDVLFRFFPCRIVPMMDELLLERAEEAFDTGIIPAIALAAHGARDAGIGEPALVVTTGVLHTATE